MPELPEVETIARGLRDTIVGKKIAEVILSGLDLRKPVSGSFAPLLSGRIIGAIHRRGKFLILELQPHAYCLIHLGMSGRILFCPLPTETAPHTHAIVRFDDGSVLHFRDPRRFGLLEAYDLPRIDLIPELESLGLDPSAGAAQLQSLRDVVGRSRQPIKAFLLDQHHIAGLGNIYACEALFHSRLHPERRCYTLTADEFDSLIRAVSKVVREAIRRRGTSFSDYIDADGLPGDNQKFLRVFQREGEKCWRCRDKIRRLRQGNRSSFYCPGCQV